MKFRRREKVVELRDGLAQFHETDAFAECKTMGELVARNIEVVLAKG